MMGLPLPNFLTFSGNLFCELFMTIFNIHFFTQVQLLMETIWEGIEYPFLCWQFFYADCERFDDISTKCAINFF